MADVPSLLSGIANKEGLLTLIYQDLARPGVRQVGLALETVLQVGNSLLLPFRLLNETSRKFEERKFKEIAVRFSEISDDNIVDVRPEIGEPILEALSYTEDERLRGMFIELLAKAADRNTVGLAHPSFTRLIESLAPDEAILLQAWRDAVNVPLLVVSLVTANGGRRKIRPIVIEPPEELICPDMVPVYVSNLLGLGVLSFDTARWINNDAAYDPLIKKLMVEFPNIKDGSIAAQFPSLKLSNGLVEDRSSVELAEGDFVYEKGLIEILPYGRSFQEACVKAI